MKNNRTRPSNIGFFICTAMALISISGCRESNDKAFQKIKSGSSGIHFENNLKATQELNAFNFTNFYNGGGVGIGDFNNDGLQDVFFTGNQVSSELYLNEGNFKFKNITGHSGIKTNRWCNGVSVIDINHDGWEDIYISVASHPAMPETANLLYINKKTSVPSFEEKAADYGLDFKGYSTQSVFLDYDLDGDLDVFVLNTNPDLQNPSVLHRPVNNGMHPSTSKLFRNEGTRDGHPFYTDVSLAAGVLYEGLGLGVTVSDFNNDGYPDIYCSNDFMSNDAFYMNQGDGTFLNLVKESMPHTSQSGMGVSAGDVNNDGLPDLFQLDMLPQDNARQKQMLTRHDYDKKEASLREPFSYEMQYMRNTLQINQGNQGRIQLFGDIGLMSGVAKTDWSWSGIIADLNNDGFKDLFVSTGYRKNVTDLDFISSYRNNNMFGSDTYKAENRLKILDKVPEIKLKNYAYLNKNGISFEDVSAGWGLDESSYASGAAYADFDNDGDLDLVISNVDQEASLYKNQTVEKSGHAMTKVILKGTSKNPQGIGVKIKAWCGDSLQYFEHYPTTSYLSTMEKGIFVSIPNRKKIDSVTVIWPGNFYQTIYDVNPVKSLTFSFSDAKKIQEKNTDPQPALFTLTEAKTGFEHRESAYIDFNDYPAMHKMLSRSGPAVAKGDLNGDGSEDIVAGAAYQGSGTSLFLQNTKGGFTKKADLKSGETEVGAVAIFDADGDGDNDVLLAAGSCERPFSVKEAYKPQLWLNDGKANFSLANNFPDLTVSAQQIVPFDMDGDGDLDLFIGGRQLPGQYPFSPPSFLLENRKGIFSDVTQTKAPFLKTLGMITAAVATDIDNDRDPDLLICGEWMPVSVLINNKKGFQLKSYEKMSGWWQSIAAADFDQDGDTDFIFGNEGLNSFYNASAEEPVFMYALDFDKNGKTDPIMGHYLQHKKVPALPRESLNQQMVQFRKKFVTFKDYSEALFDDLFSKEDLDQALYLQAGELRHMYAENKNGTLTFSPLPLESQLAPASSILIRDFDQDGKPDVVISGGFYPNEAHQGRQDASRGVFLKGNGKGSFSYLPNYKSGLYLTGDVRHSLFFEGPRLLISFRNNNSWLWHQLNTPEKK